jgi:hypothetical protein
MKQIIHNRLKNHFCTEITDRRACNGQIIQILDSEKPVKSLAVNSEGLWVDKDLKITSFCTKCNKGYPELNSGPL